jgi:hypothetical protein
VEAEHLPDLHCRAFHLAERVRDPHRVADRILRLLQLLGRSVAEQADRLLAEHGYADTANQPTHPDEPAERGSDEIIPTHTRIIPGCAARTRTSNTSQGCLH